MGEEKKGFWSRLVSGLSKTRDNIVSGIDSIFSGFSSIDDDFYEEIEEILIMGDIGVNATEAIIENLKEKVKENKIKDPAECKELLINSIKEQMDVGETAYRFENEKSVVLVIGVNGVGKTTSVGKLAGKLKDQGKKVILGKGGIKLSKQIRTSLEKGQEILVDDGKLLLKVKKAKENYAECIVVRGGVLKSKKSITIPGLELELPTLTKADMANIHNAQEAGVTGVMLPFVRGAQDVINLRKTLQAEGVGDIRIFAKIENLAGYEAVDEIIPESDMIVIARGDLGNAMPLAKLPCAQEEIADQCRKHGRAFMVVTQMLASMEHRAVPTRAEVSDIFRAVQQGAASVMLTGETAAGEYPLEAMEVLVDTVREAERYLEERR